MATDLGPAWIGLAGVLAGALVAGLFGWLTLRATLDGQRQEREHRRLAAREEREAAIELARQTFQTDTLVELQLAVARYARSCGAIHHHDEQSYAADPSMGWGRSLLGEGSNDENFQVHVVLDLLGARVADDELRSRVAEYGAYGSEMATARDPDVARTAMTQFLGCRLAVDERISHLLRELPAPSGPAPLVLSPVNLEAYRARDESPPAAAEAPPAR